MNTWAATESSTGLGTTSQNAVPEPPVPRPNASPGPAPPLAGSSADAAACAGSAAPSALLPAPGPGPLETFRRCLAIDRNTKNKTTPMPKTTRKPSVPGASAPDAASTVTSSPSPGLRQTNPPPACQYPPMTWPDESPQSTRPLAGHQPGSRTSGRPDQSGWRARAAPGHGS